MLVKIKCFSLQNHIQNILGKVDNDTTKEGHKALCALAGIVSALMVASGSLEAKAGIAMVKARAAVVAVTR